ncbi:MAG: hypothetical protein WBO97_17010 [Tepidiformaceae bacterium]
MQYAITPSSLPTIRTVAARADLTPTGIANAATRVRSWALVSGEQIVGLPFLRMCGELYCEVHVPVAGRVIPHPETGLTAECGDGGPAVALRTVRLEEVRCVLRELTGEIAVDYGVAGPVEFHPASAEFRQGTLIWPVHRVPRTVVASNAPQLVEVGA